MGWVDVDLRRSDRGVRQPSEADLRHRRHRALVNRSAELVAAGYGPGHQALVGFSTAAGGARADRGRCLLWRRRSGW